MNTIQSTLRNIRANMGNGIDRTKVVIIAGVILLCVLAGVSGLFYSSNFTPLLIGILIALPVLFFAFIKNPVWVFYASIFIVFLPLGLIPFQIQSYLNRGSTILVFALWAVNALIFRKKITIPAATWFFIAFVIWCGLSLYWSISLSQGLTLFQTYLLRMVLFLFLGVNLIDTKKKLDYFMITLALNGVLIISAGLIQIVLNGYTPGQRFSVLSMNENGVGIQLLIAFIGVAWWGLQPSKRFQTVKRVLVLLFMTISMGFIAITGSRGSAISFVAMLFIFALFKPTRFLFVFGVVLVLLGFLFAPFLFQTTIERFLGATGETTLGGREGLWQAAQLLIKDHFLIGVGVGNSAIVIKDYLSNPAVSMNLMPVQVWTQDLISLHNPILTIISDTGVVGFILYFGMVVVAGLSLILKYMKDRNYFVYLYLAVIGSATVGYSLSWFKAGGIEIDFSTYLMVLILVLPVCIKEWNVKQEI